MFDLAIIETGNGGDLVINGNDIGIVTDIGNMPYLAMFGGNKESTINQSTTLSQGAQSFDWWGNNLLMPSNQSQQFNSLLENIINTTALNSAGRIIIQNAVIADLQFLQPGAKIKTTVTIVATDEITLEIIIQQFQQLQTIFIKFKKLSTGDFSISDFNSDFSQ